MDWIPVVSQIKSAIQAATGNMKGARETQENFSRRCIVISQLRSAVEAAMGREQDARRTQIEFLTNAVEVASKTIDGIPVVGHIKGGIHYACKDKEGGDQAMKSASRTAGVVGGAVGGFFIAGPPGAIGLAVAGGAAMDSITTAVDSAVHKEFRANGIFSPIQKPKDVDAWLGTVLLIGGDALVGVAIGRVASAARGVAASAAIDASAESASKVGPNPGLTMVAYTGAVMKLSNIVSLIYNLIVAFLREFTQFFEIGGPGNRPSGGKPGFGEIRDKVAKMIKGVLRSEKVLEEKKALLPSASTPPTFDDDVESTTEEILNAVATQQQSRSAHLEADDDTDLPEEEIKIIIGKHVVDTMNPSPRDSE